MNPNDVIRDSILRYLYDVHGAAKSPKSAATGIRDLQKAMKEAHGYKQQEVASNLDYLIQKGWAVTVVEDRSFQTPRGTTQQAERVTSRSRASASIFSRARLPTSARTPTESTSPISEVSRS